MAGLAAALGPQFAGKPWITFAPPIGAFYTAAIPAHCGAAIGALAECVRGCKAGIAPHTTAVLQVLLPGAAEADPQGRSKAVYGLGLLAQHSEDAAALDPIHPLLVEKAL